MTTKHSFRAETDAAMGWFLFIVVLLVFLPAVFNGFTTYDDPEYVTSNRYVQSGLTLEGLAWAFRAHGANWHPLTWWSHILDGQLFGMRAWGHHLGSVLLHAANAVLVFRVLASLTGFAGRSFIVALLFGLHPLRVESVAWVAERKDVLSASFWLLTLLAYAAYVRRAELPAPNHKWRYYALALGLFALGLLSKSMLVTLPCTLLLLDFWPLRRWRTRSAARLAGEKVPFFLLAAGMSLIAYFAQYHGTAMVSALPLTTRVGNALVSYCRYLAKLFWPENLCAIYPYPAAWPFATVCAAALVLIAITALALIQFKRRPCLVMGWFWFLGTLVPVIGLVQIGNQSMADRYTYIPTLGIFVMVVWGIAEFIDVRRRQEAIVSVTTLVACAWTVLTEKQIGYWKNSETMYQRAVEVTRDNTLALVGLGTCLAGRGELDAAIERYRQAIRVAPDYYESHYNLGLALMDKGKLDEAIDEFHTAIKCRPRVAASNLSLGVALERQGDTAGAIAQFQEAATLDPGDPLPHTDLGRLLVTAKDFSKAAREFQLAVNLRPNDPLLHYDLASALLNSRHSDEALTEYRAALKLAPDNAEIHNDLGMALGGKGDLDAAIREFQEAVRLNPQYSVAAANLAKALRMKAPAVPAGGGNVGAQTGK